MGGLFALHLAAADAKVGAAAVFYGTFSGDEDF
jgi:dienelactone hydrolase